MLIILLHICLFFPQQRRTKHLINIEHISSDIQSIGLSPVRLYHLNTTNSFENVDCPKNTKCYQNYKFHWHGQKQCHINLICSHLGDHICADHGLLMKTSNESNELDKLHICHIDQIYEAKLSQTTEFTAQIWHVSTASVDMSCYFWCQNEVLTNLYEIKELDAIPLDSKKVRKHQSQIFFTALIN